MPHDQHIKVAGTIEDVFAHRFVLRTASGKLLADLGPRGAEQIKLKTGDTITIEGEKKPSEVKVRHITQNGKTTEIHHPDKPHGPGHHDPKAHDHDPSAALKSVRADGYEVIGVPRGKPKHFEVLAKRDGAFVELHVGLDGQIHKSKPVRKDEPKWADDLR
jgi:hypothetical protein